MKPHILKFLDEAVRNYRGAREDLTTEEYITRIQREEDECVSTFLSLAVPDRFERQEYQAYYDGRKIE